MPFLLKKGSSGRITSLSYLLQRTVYTKCHAHAVQ